MKCKYVQTTSDGTSWCALAEQSVKDFDEIKRQRDELVDETRWRDVREELPTEEAIYLVECEWDPCSPPLTPNDPVYATISVYTQ